jgi:PAS domain S-box-containing protein
MVPDKIRILLWRIKRNKLKTSSNFIKYREKTNTVSSETDKQVNIYYKLDEKLLQLIATSINDIITIQDLAGNCHYISPSVEKLLGYSPEEIVGTNILGYYHPDDRPRLLDNIGRAKAGLAPTTSCECRCCCKDGSVRWLESKASRIHDDRGNLTELLVISRDITARKQMEQELRNSFDRLALAIDGAKAGVWGFWPGSDRRGKLPAVVGYPRLREGRNVVYTRGLVESMPSGRPEAGRKGSQRISRRPAG